MYRADFNIFSGAIKLVENKVHRDFIEITNLQSSNLSLAFMNKTIEYLQAKFFEYFLEKKPNYSLYIKNYNSNVVDGSRYKVVINPLSGIKNFLHAIPYFCTVITLFDKDEAVMGVINNYATNEMFYVMKGQGTHLNNQKLRVSNKTDNTLIAVKYDLNKSKFKAIVNNLPMFKINNCSILDCCNTAAGKYDASILFDVDKGDMPLAQLMIAEAGGLTRKIDETTYLFSNGVYMDKVLDIIK